MEAAISRSGHIFTFLLQLATVESIQQFESRADSAQRSGPILAISKHFRAPQAISLRLYQSSDIVSLYFDSYVVYSLLKARLMHATDANSL